MSDAADVIAKRFTTEIVGHTDDHNGGRLSGATAGWLAQLAIATLENQGFTVVKLPEPADGNYWYRDVGYFWVDDSDAEFLVTTKHGSTFGNPDEARETAIALLAAANEADLLRSAYDGEPA